MTARQFLSYLHISRHMCALTLASVTMAAYTFRRCAVNKEAHFSFIFASVLRPRPRIMNGHAQPVKNRGGSGGS